MSRKIEYYLIMKRYIFIAGAVVLSVALVLFLIHANQKKKSEPEASIAFVIDDWGYNNRYIDLIFDIERPVTLSVLPNLRYSSYIAESVLENNSLYDIIVHVPMESKSGRAAERLTILSDMTEKEIISALDKSIKSVPGAIGISCHQGSKLTEDERAMRIIMEETKKRGLFFLDSVTTPDSVCKKVAGAVGLDMIGRDVFLDITDQTDMDNFESYVRTQMDELMNEALVKGSATGIGHNKRITLEIIKEYVPIIEKKGIKIVPLKELVE